MSTKTNFKRIALVAVAALGLGVLSSAPSQAVGNVVVTVGGTATTAPGQSDSTTAATISITGTIENVSDTITVSFVGNGTLGDSVTSSTANSAFQAARLMYLDTTTAARTQVGTTLGSAGGESTNLKLDSKTAGTIYTINSASIGNVGAKFGIQLDSTSAQVSGTYSFTVFVKQYTAGSTTVTNSYSVSVVSAAPATASATASSATSTAFIDVSGTPSADVAVSAPNTSTGTSAALVYVTLKNAASGTSAVKDSLTVTIDKGNVGTSSSAAMGKNILVAYSGAATPIYVFADGSTGTGTITIATKNAGSFTKTISWYGTDVKSIIATQRLTVIGGTETAGTGNAIRAQALDVNSTNLAAGTALYSYSSDTSVVSNNGTACGATAYSTTDAAWFTYCPLTVVTGKSGSVNITLRDAATVAASTVSSNVVAVRVSAGVASSFTLTTDKASYAPGEKGYLIVTVKDAAGLVMPARSSAATLAAGGISFTGQLGNSSDTLTATDFATARSSTPSSNDPIKVYTFYAPASAGTVTFSAKGASTFSAASQATASTVTITVADSASAALAAVSALAVTVASLKTLITTLTNLVLKIQKKVKA
jgi:hypothetical protein